jgi:small redox-active disulfide protein 2
VVIKVLGTGCANCQKTKVLAKEVVAELNLDAQVEEVTDIADIMAYGVMSTPAIVVDEKVVGSGGVPSHDQMVSLLQAAQA